MRDSFGYTKPVFVFPLGQLVLFSFFVFGSGELTYAGYVSFRNKTYTPSLIGVTKVFWLFMEQIDTPQGLTTATGSGSEKTQHQINKADFLRDLEQIRELLTGYGNLLDNIADSDSWKQQAHTFLEEQHKNVGSEDNALSKFPTLIALFVFLMGKTSQQRFHFQMPTRVGAIPEIENKNLVEYSSHIKEISPSIQAMTHDIAALVDPAKTTDPDRTHTLMNGVNSFFKALLRQDWEDLQLVMTHLNLVTTTKESHNLIEQIARIARDIYNSLNQFSEYFTVESLSHSTDELPDAVVKLKSVISRLEEAANTNLDSLDDLSAQTRDSLERIQQSEEVLANSIKKLEELGIAHPHIAEKLGEVETIVREKLHPELQVLRERNQEYSQIYLDLVSNQSFQDLTGQALKKVIGFIETLQFKLIELLPTYSGSLGLSETAEGDGEQKKAAAQTQDQVDQMLAALGF